MNHTLRMLLGCMLPLILVCIRLARQEERDVLDQHHETYHAYTLRTPMFFPNPFKSLLSHRPTT